MKVSDLETLWNVADDAVSSNPNGKRGKLRIFIIHGSHHLTDHFFNGDGLVAWGFISELARRGHTVHVATDRLNVNAAAPANLTMVEFPRTEKNAVAHYIAYMRKARAYYERLAADEGVDVVHQMNPVVRGLSLALLGKRVPIVLGTYVGDWDSHPSAPNYARPSLQKRAAMLAKAAIDAIQQHFASVIVLATPHALKRVPLSIDVGTRVDFMHHGVDTNLYSPIPSASDPAYVPQRIVYVGSLNANKGVFTLADAFAEVVRRQPGASLLFVGDGPQLKPLQRRLLMHGLLDKVTFAGRASRSEVAGWLRSSDVLCAPSYGEPYGQNVLEAMAVGKPVVITTDGGHRYIGDPAGALSIAPGDVEQLATALTLVLSDPARAKAMGDHNRRIAEERHAWPKVTDRLESIYARAISAWTQNVRA